MMPDTHGFMRYDSTNDFDFAEKIITYDLAELQSSSHMIPGQFDSLDKTAGNSPYDSQACKNHIC